MATDFGVQVKSLACLYPLSAILIGNPRTLRRPGIFYANVEQAFLPVTWIMR